jgi:hypothetical protein
MPMNPTKGCLCPECLEKAISAHSLSLQKQ